MIGRFDLTPDRHRRERRDGASLRIARRIRSASILAVAAWAFAGGAPSEAPAQATPGPKAKIQAVVPAASDPLEAPAPAPSPRPPGGIIMAKDKDEPPKRDDQVDPAQAPPPADEANPFPPAREPPGGHPAGAAKGPAGEPDGFALPADRLTSGRQRVQLSVEVQANPVVNKDKESTVRIVVVNEGLVDAYGVTVIYSLPDGLKFVSAPESDQDPVNKSQYYFKKSTLAAGGEWAIPIRVVAHEVRSVVEHSATVTAKAGSRASTTVQEPKLRVEATASPSSVLKGGQVRFAIVVKNPGSGPARNVTVQAKFSGGLKYGDDDIVAQTIPVIKPGGEVVLEDLEVKTVAGGDQTCTVDVRSDDVVSLPEEHRVVKAVRVTKPELKLVLSGEENRFTGQTIEYRLTVTNPGSAPAKMVKVSASLPAQGGRLKPGPLPTGARFDAKSRKLFWLIEQLEPKTPVEMTFFYDTSAPGLYRCAAEATSGELHPTDQINTQVSGIAALDVQIRQSPSTRIIDVGKSTAYEITIKNLGTKEALQIQLRGTLSPNLRLTQQSGVDKGEVNYNVNTGEIVFPPFDRLAPGGSIVLWLDVQAVKAGSGRCQVTLAHADQGPDEAKVEDVVATTVTGPGRPRAPAAAPK